MDPSGVENPTTLAIYSTKEKEREVNGVEIDQTSNLTIFLAFSLLRLLLLLLRIWFVLFGYIFLCKCEWWQNRPTNQAVKDENTTWPVLNTRKTFPINAGVPIAATLFSFQFNFQHHQLFFISRSTVLFSFQKHFNLKSYFIQSLYFFRLLVGFHFNLEFGGWWLIGHHFCIHAWIVQLDWFGRRMSKWFIGGICQNIAKSTAQSRFCRSALVLVIQGIRTGGRTGRKNRRIEIINQIQFKENLKTKIHY